MPVGFLTDEQRRQYGRFHGEPNSADLALIALVGLTLIIMLVTSGICVEFAELVGLL